MERKSRPPRLVVSTLLAASVAWAAALPGAARAEAGVTRTSRPVRLLRSWEENVKIGKREEPRRVQILIDYAKGQARQDSYDLRGRLLSSRTFTRGMPAPSPEEIAEAFDLVRADPGFASIFARFSVVLEGGFLLEEDAGMPCGPGTRCVHVMLLSSDRSGLIRHVVVDLAARFIPYPVYTPSVLDVAKR
ncbi:MAG: hypothetical protein ABI968_04225 [Acidobacteriota bacterium]